MVHCAFSAAGARGFALRADNDPAQRNSPPGHYRGRQKFRSGGIPRRHIATATLTLKHQTSGEMPQHLDTAESGQRALAELSQEMVNA